MTLQEAEDAVRDNFLVMPLAKQAASSDWRILDGEEASFIVMVDGIELWLPWIINAWAKMMRG